MIELSLAEVAEATGGACDRAPSTTVADVATDSRLLAAGALFVALRGEHADGHDHVDDAVAGGAAALLVERVRTASPEVPCVVVDDTWEALRRLAATVRRRVAPRTVAITGSFGKTTTKDLTAAAVGAGRRVVAAQGSFNNELGVPLTLLALTHDTEVLVTEIGARHVGDIADLAAWVAPDVAVVTAVGEVHLEIFGSVEAIARTKGELVDALGPDGLAVLNLDDPRVAAMAARAPAVLGYGLSDDADVTAEDVRLDGRAHASLTAVTPWGRAHLALPLAGRHQVGNALAALSVAGHLGVDVPAAAAAIGRARVSPWRGDVHDADGVLVVNDAYNANPTATVAALETLVALEGVGRRWAVLGEMAEIGEGSERAHHDVGQRCAQLGVDRLVAVGPPAAALAEGARAGGLADGAVVEVADAAEAAAHLEAQVASGDAVLVKASRVAALEAVALRLVAARESEA